MKRKIVYAMGGTPITLLSPENEEDEAELDRMYAAGELDGDGFTEWLHSEEALEYRRQQEKAANPTRKKTIIVDGVMMQVDVE